MAEKTGKEKKGLATIDIQGKPYVMVHERLRYFRDNYRDHTLVSELLSNGDGKVVFKATILNHEQVPVATGHAMEKEGGTFINKTSHIENAETSAWGRALANFGIGIDESVASADEVGNAVQGQGDKPHPMTKKLDKAADSPERPVAERKEDERPETKPSPKVAPEPTSDDLGHVVALHRTVTEQAGADVADAMILEASSFMGKDGKPVKGFATLAKLEERAKGGKIGKWITNIKNTMQEKLEKGRTVGEVARDELDNENVPF